MSDALHVLMILVGSAAFVAFLFFFVSKLFPEQTKVEETKLKRAIELNREANRIMFRLVAPAMDLEETNILTPKMTEAIADWRRKYEKEL